MPCHSQLNSDLLDWGQVAGSLGRQPLFRTAPYEKKGVLHSSLAASRTGSGGSVKAFKPSGTAPDYACLRTSKKVRVEHGGRDNRDIFDPCYRQVDAFDK